MLWAALSAFMMSITGKGDDTFAFRKSVDRVHKAVEHEVHDTARRQEALATLDRVKLTFAAHRARTAKISQCLEKADRRYSAGAADYQRCLVDARRAWDEAAEQFVVLDHAFRTALTPAEYAAVRRSAQR
jgi:hypothetical protein